VHEAIDRRDGHRRFREHLVPGGKRLVGSDGGALALVAFGDQLEQHAALGLIAADVTEVVQDQQVDAIEPRKLGGQPQIAMRVSA